MSLLLTGIVQQAKNNASLPLATENHYYNSASPYSDDPPMAQDGHYVVIEGNTTTDGRQSWLESAEPGVLASLNTAGGTIWIKGGLYGAIGVTSTGGDNDTDRIYIKNYDGQVECYDCIFGVSNITIDGSGDLANYPCISSGWDGAYGSFGIRVSNRFINNAKIGFQINGEALENVTVKNVQMGDGGFAGAMVKRNAPSDTTDWDNIWFEDCLIAYTYSEGIYLGRGSWNNDTYNDPVEEHGFVNSGLRNVLFFACGSESIQVNNLKGFEIINCSAIASSSLWRDPWDVPSQDGTLQVAYAYDVAIKRCLFHGGRSLFNLVPDTNVDFEAVGGQTFDMLDNLFTGCKGAVGYMANAQGEDRNTISIDNNDFRRIEFIADEVFKGAFGTQQAYQVGIANTSPDVTIDFDANNYEVDGPTINFTQDAGQNAGNNETTIPNFELDSLDFLPANYQKFEAWGDGYVMSDAIANRGSTHVANYTDFGGDAISWPAGSIVWKYDVNADPCITLWELLSGDGTSGGVAIEPGTDGAVWGAIPMLDFNFVISDNYHRGRGVLNPDQKDKPFAANVTIGNEYIVGQTLTCNYVYRHYYDTAESGTTFQWYRYDDAGLSVNKTSIGGATASAYEIQGADDGKYLACEVTASDGTNSDIAVSSNASQQIQAAPNQVIINFGSNSAAGNVNNYTNPIGTTPLSDMIDSAGEATTIDIVKLSGSGQSLTSIGEQTGDNSGIVADDLLIGCARTFANDTGLFYRLDGLTPSSNYVLDFIGSVNDGGAGEITEYQRLNASLVAQETVTLEVSENTANSAQLTFTADGSGRAYFRFRRQSGSSLGYLNTVIITLP